MITKEIVKEIKEYLIGVAVVELEEVLQDLDIKLEKEEYASLMDLCSDKDMCEKCLENYVFARVVWNGEHTGFKADVCIKCGRTQ